LSHVKSLVVGHLQFGHSFNAFSAAASGLAKASAAANYFLSGASNFFLQEVKGSVFEEFENCIDSA